MILLSTKAIATEFAFQAVWKDLPDVLDYLLKNYSLKHYTLKDSGGKSLIFAAVLSGKENMLGHLLKVIKSTTKENVIKYKKIRFNGMKIFLLSQYKQSVSDL